MQYNEGDLVEAVRGESVIRGRLQKTLDDFWVGDSTRLVSTLRGGDWTLTVIEKAPKLPTEPGLYARGDVPLAMAAVYVLSADGDWYRQDRKGTPEITLEVVREFHARGNFPRLAPVPVTAKKVLDAIRARIGSIDSAHDFQAVAASFGVTE